MFSPLFAMYHRIDPVNIKAVVGGEIINLAHSFVSYIEEVLMPLMTSH